MMGRHREERREGVKKLAEVEEHVVVVLLLFF